MKGTVESCTCSFEEINSFIMFSKLKEMMVEHQSDFLVDQFFFWGGGFFFGGGVKLLKTEINCH